MSYLHDIARHVDLYRLPLDLKRAFIESANPLILGFSQLIAFRYVGNIARIAVIDANYLNSARYKELSLSGTDALQKVSPALFRDFTTAHNQGSIVLAYSWLDTLLQLAEETLFLTHPEGEIGDNVQIKFGKILNAESLDDLIHELIQKRLRDRANWGLAGRLKDLGSRFGITYRHSEKDWLWMSELRNNAAHNRSLGSFEIQRGRVTFRSVEKKGSLQDEETDKFLRLLTKTQTDIYVGTAKRIGLTRRFNLHKENLILFESTEEGFAKLVDS